VDNFTKIFPTAPGLDQDLGNVGILLDLDREISGSMEFSEYYSQIHRPQGDSGDITPVSGGSEVEFNTNDATAGSTAECDVTVTEDIDSCFIGDEELMDTKSLSSISLPCNLITSLTENNLLCQGNITPKVISPLSANINIYTNVLHPSNSDSFGLKHIENTDRLQPSTSRIYNEFDRSKDFKNLLKKSNIYDKEMPSSSKNIANLGSDKWCTSKEKFLDNTVFAKIESVPDTRPDKSPPSDLRLNPGTVRVKEHYIEPPRMTRISKSFHGKSPTSSSYLDISTAIPRRASEGIPLTSRNLNLQPETLKQDFQNSNSGNRRKINIEKVRSNRPQFVTQLSQPCGSTTLHSPGLHFRKTSLTDMGVSKKRFTTTLVDEAEHAASVGICVKPCFGSDPQGEGTSDKEKDDKDSNCVNKKCYFRSLSSDKNDNK
jgi:hypothetical protein